MAIQLPGREGVTFGELLQMGVRAQMHYLSKGLQPGDSVLLLDSLGPRLYASVIGILATGATAVLVEPWMPIERVNRVIEMVKPKIFAAGTIGRLWGVRLKSVREIPHWIHPRSWAGEGLRSKGAQLDLHRVAPETPGILTFTSGTTGAPKGVVRGQGYMVHQHRVLTEALHLEAHQGPDLCIFANFALANLASGRGSIIVGPKWKSSDLEWIANLPPDEQPASLTTGPAFLLRLIEAQERMGTRLSALESVHVGGALTDCWIFEKAFDVLRNTHFMHIYGSSEAEPVAVSDAKVAVEKSRAKGYFQTLYLGSPITDIRADVEANNVWVTGPHVCPLYVGGAEENQLHKRRDDDGRIWHSMGDRIRVEGGDWWYAGRSGQRSEHFDLEQSVYSAIGSSKAFVVPETEGLSLCVEPPSDRRDETFEKLREMKAVSRLFEVKIQRDRRHRARIDRVASEKTRRAWRVG